MPLFARLARLFHVARGLYAGWVALACLLVATALVCVTLPGRQVAGRTEDEAWVPLRQLTPREAAFLLRDGAVHRDHAAIVGLTEATVLLASRDYVREAASAPGTAPRKRLYSAAPANWSGLSTLYELDRRALEAELGRPFRVDEIDGTFIERYPVSLQPSLVPLYALVEIAFLTLWGTALIAGLLSGLQHLPGPRVWLAGLASWMVAPCLFVWLYSPAFYDADFFHQRIVLESVAAGLLVPVLMGVWLVPPLVAWALLAGVTSHLARARARGGPRQRRRLLAAYVGGSLVLFVVWRVSAWATMRRRCAAELAHIEARVGAGNALTTLLEHRSLLPRASGPLTSARRCRRRSRPRLGPPSTNSSRPRAPVPWASRFSCSRQRAMGSTSTCCFGAGATGTPTSVCSIPASLSLTSSPTRAAAAPFRPAHSGVWRSRITSAPSRCPGQAGR